MTQYQVSRCDWSIFFLCGVLCGLLLRVIIILTRPQPPRDADAQYPTERPRGRTKPIAIVPKEQAG